jgi:hypothetical protein
MAYSKAKLRSDGVINLGGPNSDSGFNSGNEWLDFKENCETNISGMEDMQ